MKMEVLKNMAGVVLFYLIIVLGVLIIDARMDSLPDSPNNISVAQ